MKPLPIRWKFALWAAALVGVAIALFAAGTLRNLYEEQVEAVDIELTAELRRLERLPPGRLLGGSVEELAGFHEGLVIAVFDAHGHIAHRSPEFPESVARAAINTTGIHTVRTAQGGGWRAQMFRHGEVVAVVGFSLDEVRQIVRDLLIAYALSIPIVLIVSALGGWWVAGRALSPLRDLTAAAESIGAEQLDHRVPEPGADDEIRRLAAVLNAMLARLEKSFQQTRRFAADASHELRTPLTIMQGEIERLLRTPQLEPAHEQKLVSLQEELGRLDRITEDLLLLARFDAGHIPPRSERVDFSALVRTACDDAELLAASQQIELRPRVPEGVAVQGSDAHLRRLVLGLLDNAVRYNQPRGRIECTLETDPAAVRLRVRNTGPGIAPAARARVFERFFRGDAARLRGGHGLGLSLGREIARAHGGDLELSSATPDGLTEFVVTLPPAAPQLRPPGE
jgi:heavy metal sensor kinase